MSVTYYYFENSGVTSAGTSSTSGNVLNTNEMMLVNSGTTVSGAILETSAVDLTGSGSAVSNPGGSAWVYNGGSITGQGITQPLSGGAAVVGAGGILDGATADLGGGIMVLSGGATSGTILNQGFETIVSGGTASATTTSGGNENIYAGGSATSTNIAATGGQEIYSGGTAVSATIGAQGTQEVWSGGTANFSVINGDGTQIVHAGGGSYESSNIAGISQVYGFDLSGTVIDTGVIEVMSGGNAQSTYLVSGGAEVISAGGKATGANLEILGTQTVMSGGTAYNTFLTGGIMKVLSGGTAILPVLTSGAEYTTSSGTTTITTGGEIVVSGGGTVIGASAAYGLIEVLSGGTATATILSGGQQIVMGGTASGTHILSGGSEVVTSGTSIDPIVYAGGSETVYSGATVTNVEISGAGTLSLESGAITTGGVLFGPEGGKLQLIGTTLPSVTINGFAVGDSIDLNNLSGTAASYANGTLTVTGASGTVASLSLGTAPDGFLTVTSDGHGGTLVTVTAYTAAQAVSAYQSNGLPGGAQIADSAADVSANIDGLESIAAAGKLVGVTLTDSGTPTISITAAQLAADGKAIADISGNFTLKVDASSATGTVTGLSAHATVLSFSGASTDYSVTSTASDGSSFVLTQASTSHTLTISSVTALQFSDFTEFVATGSAPSGTTLSSLNVAELYSAALDRAPDVTGLNFYENAIKANPTLSGVTLAEFFLSSSEYTSAHTYAQTSAGDTQFVNDLYTNILHRTGSSSEVAFYTNFITTQLSGLTAGTTAYSAAELQAHAQVLEYFSASAEFLSDIQITAQHSASASHWLLLV